MVKMERFQFFNDAGIDFLTFLVDKKKKKVSRLNQGIKDIREKLNPFNQEEAYRLYSQELKEIQAMEE